jgi:hypothetical protein
MALDRWKALALALFAYQGLNFCDKSVHHAPPPLPSLPLAARAPPLTHLLHVCM